MRTDVAVIGAGPAGSIAARKLAAAGVTVTLLERASFPRDKACGDGVNSRSLTVLARNGLSDWVSQFPAPEILRITSPSGQVLDVQPPANSNGRYGRTIPRRQLDARLTQMALEAGARLVENTQVRAIEYTPDSKPVIVANRFRTIAELAILADGSHAPVTRRLGLVQGPPELIAVRQYFAGDAGPSNRLEIHFQREISPGYTWLFPMNHGCLNVGTGTFTRRARRGDVSLKDILANLTSDPQALDGRLTQAEPIGPILGHPLRTRLDKTRTHAERVLVAGDAAGLVNPLTGEGISSAMESGELAASHALQALNAGNFSAQALSTYSRALEARYGADQRAARILRWGVTITPLFNRAFHRLRQDRELALLIGYVIVGYKSPRLALRPGVLLRLLA